jgi:hypothetical protein
MKWVLLDEEGNVVRRFNYAHEGCIQVVEPIRTYAQLLELVGECLL